MKGVVFTTDEKMFVKEFDQPLYKSVGDVVGGWIEVVHPRGLEDPFCFICNEEGLLRDLPLNPIGCVWYRTAEHGCPICGNIVVMKTGMTEEGPDIVGLMPDEIEKIKAMALELSSGLIADLDKQEKPTSPSMTRADRIRAMSDEELAAYWAEHYDEFCPNSQECGEMLNKGQEIPAEKCIGCALRWLQEVEA